MKNGKMENSEIIIIKIPVGAYLANCYLIADSKTGEVVIIDPGAEPEKILSAIKEINLKPKFILLTHNHFDHIGAVKEIKNIWSCDVLRLNENEKIKIGEIEIRIIETPGHTPESVCYIVKNPVDGGAGIIFTGDTLFKKGIGRTDLEGGDFNQIQKSLKRLMEFPDHFKVWPGHGEETSIGEERKSNPFL